MSKKLSLSIAFVVIGTSLLFAAGFAGKANSAAPAKVSKGLAQGGTLNVDLFTDVDYTDPALDYLSTGWELEYSTCLKLMNYPGCERAQGRAAHPGGATGFPRCRTTARRTTSTSGTNTKFSNGAKVTAANFAVAINRDLPTRRCSRPSTPFISRHRRRPGCPRRQGQHGLRRQGQGPHLIITADQAAPDFLARIAMPFFCAIPTNLPIDPNGVDTLPVCRPVLHRGRARRASRSCSKREPELQGQAPAQRRTRSSTRSVTRSRPAPAADRVRRRPTTPPAASRRRVRRGSPTKYGSTRGSSASSRCSASTTSR